MATAPRFHILLILSAVLFGCSDPKSPSNSSSNGSKFGAKIKVVATVGMVADIVREVGGKHVEVEQICGSGVDPHLYKATRDDVATMSSADIIFFSGLLLEGKLTDTLVKLARKKTVVAVTENLTEDHLLEPDDFADHYDPHVWMDVSEWSNCVGTVLDILIQYDPVHANDYRMEATRLEKELKLLHEYGKTSLASIPEGKRVLVTSHDAFNYLGRAYGLEVQGVQGISTESEAGLERVNELVDMLVERKVEAVFIESSVPRKSIDSLLEGVRSKGHEIKIGGELYSDAMGSEGTYEGTYIGMLDHNITTITRALGGTAPAKGLNGKLTE
ncbi:zinc ABC transporter substrate-binding protein [Planctomicrobium sp.]|jgi:manganese/zinc/iron transport system substrate-binding protein|nr:zinc ABC transporter substrate-binding protein [Planctomicrobium sp.]MBT5019963.1 zinc ABC transporter solute-binding protein [Planctomicrobium sp.]MDB4733328.1 zinc ABC transporter substrate-binding protein [Planctomicrobium sp.]